jgi:hypothetical protein
MDLNAIYTVWIRVLTKHMLQKSTLCEQSIVLISGSKISPDARLVLPRRPCGRVVVAGL